MSLESIEEHAGVETDAESGRVERFGLGGGLSEMDFLSRQRYLENSGCVCTCVLTSLQYARIKRKTILNMF